MRMRLLLLSAVLLSIVPLQLASATTITFDELPFGTTVDGMVIDIVTFGFSPLQADINDQFGTQAFVAEPYIEGPSFDGNLVQVGTLSLAFAIPVTDVAYGFALNTGTPVPGIGSEMELFEAGADFQFPSLGIFSAPATDTGFDFVEGRVSGASATPIGSAIITFDFTTNSRFAFDNLTYNQVPEPSSLAALTSLAAVGLCFGAWRRR